MDENMTKTTSAPGTSTRDSRDEDNDWVVPAEESPAEASRPAIIFGRPGDSEPEARTPQKDRRFPGISDIGSVERPYETDVVLERSENQLHIYIPPQGLDSIGITTCILALAFGGVGVGTLVARLTGAAAENNILLFSAIFGLVGLFMTYTSLKRIFGKSDMVFSPKGIFFQTGLAPFLKVRESSLDELQDIKMEVAARVNDVPIYRLALSCGSEKWRFGSSLDEDEREWIAGNIRDFALAHAVGK